MNLDELFGRFLQEKQFLEGFTEKTIQFYNASYKAFKKAGLSELPANLQQCVITLRQGGMKAQTINTYRKGINSFFSWLTQNDYLTGFSKLKPLKTERKIKPSYSDEDVRKIIAYRPKNFTQKRLHTLLCLLIDSGVRINEALTLTRHRLNFEALHFTVYGKGRKERVLPMSLELRKILFRFLKEHPHPLVFPACEGQPLNEINVWRDAQRLIKKLGIECKGLHSFRRTFTRCYLKHGGNVIYLKAALGHARIETKNTWRCLRKTGGYAPENKPALTAALA